MSTSTRTSHSISQPRPELISSPEDLAAVLADGRRCYVYWMQENSEFKTAAGLIVECRGEHILVDHWVRRWYRFDDPAFLVVVWE